jgi:hypothetical protein
MAKKRSKKATKKTRAKNAPRKARRKGRSSNATRAVRSGKKRTTKKVPKKTTAKKAPRKAKAKAGSTSARRPAPLAKKRRAKRRPTSSPALGKSETIETPALEETSVAKTSESITDAGPPATIAQKVSNALTAAVEKLSDVIGRGDEKNADSEPDETGSVPTQH